MTPCTSRRRSGRSRADPGALRVRARRLLFLGLPAGAAVAAVAPAVAGAAWSMSSSIVVLGVGLLSARRAARRSKFVVGLLIALLIGFEAATLRRWTLDAPRLDAMSASSSATIVETAERRFFDAWMRARRGHARQPTPPPTAAAAPVRRGRRAVRRHRPVPGAGSAAMSVAIVDYGSGNLHSAAKAFERAARESGHDQPIVVTSDPDAVAPRRSRGAARRRRLRRLPARARRHSRHGRGAERSRARAAAGRSSASASACS